MSVALCSSISSIIKMSVFSLYKMAVFCCCCCVLLLCVCVVVVYVLENGGSAFHQKQYEL